MNKEIKKILLDIGQKPDYSRKDKFIKMYRKKYGNAGIGMFYILKNQLSYIRIPVWIISFIALFVAIWGIHANREVVFTVSAIMPFVSGIAIFDSLRSRLYGMTEMENVTLVSVRGILFARFICVGTVHIILLIILAVLIGTNNRYGIMMTSAMIVIPYLLSSVGSLELERTPLGRKNAMICIVVSALVSICMSFLQRERVVFTTDYRWIWYLTAITLMVMECIEIKKNFQQEEYAWN